MTQPKIILISQIIIYIRFFFPSMKGGQANGYNGKSFYIIVQCTDNWPDEYQTASGQERAHDYLLKNVMGLDYDQSRITCGGFTYTDGELKFSSTWLNNKDQKGAKSDGNKFLSEPEKTLVTFCFDEYKKYGNHHIFEIPSSVDKEFSE